MTLSIPVVSKQHSFGAKTKEQKKSSDKNDNPISQKGEAANLTKATFLGGLALGGKLLFELFDGDFIFEHAGNKATNMVNKNKPNLAGSKKILCTIGASIGLVGALIAGFAAIYTLFNAPKIVYNSKVNSHVKKNDMDVFISANEAEKNIYKQMNELAKNADDNEKEKLKDQFTKMQFAKTQAPDFIYKNSWFIAISSCFLKRLSMP